MQPGQGITLSDRVIMTPGRPHQHLLAASCRIGSVLAYSMPGLVPTKEGPILYDCTGMSQRLAKRLQIISSERSLCVVHVVLFFRPRTFSRSSKTISETLAQPPS